MQLELIGRGAQGFTILALDLQSNEKVAIKILRRYAPVCNAVSVMSCSPFGRCAGRCLPHFSSTHSSIMHNAKYVEREASTHTWLVHPHIIQLREVLSWAHQALPLNGAVNMYAAASVHYKTAP